MSHRNSLIMVLLYLMTGLAFGLGLVLLLVGERTELPLAIAAWLAGAVLVRANYRRSML